MRSSERMLGVSEDRKKAWKDFAVRKAYRLGVFELGRIIHRNKIPILCYHRFATAESNHGALQPRDFEAHLRYLTKRFTLISFKEMSYVRAGKAQFKNPLILTVDDGYRDFIEVALPLLEKYGASATFFVTTRFIDGEIWLWPDIVQYAIFNTNRDAIELPNSQCKLPLRTLADREKACDRVQRICKQISEEAKREFLAELPDRLGVRIPQRPPSEFRPATWEDLKSLCKARVEIGSHTLTHPILSRASLEQTEKEIGESKKRIERMLDCEVIAFSYPNGIVGDYAEEHKKILERSGYFCAVTVNLGFTTLDSDLFELNRIVAPYDIARFARQLSGIDRFRWQDGRGSARASLPESRFEEPISL